MADFKGGGYRAYILYEIVRGGPGLENGGPPLILGIGVGSRLCHPWPRSHSHRPTPSLFSEPGEGFRVCRIGLIRHRDRYFCRNSPAANPSEDQKSAWCFRSLTAHGISLGPVFDIQGRDATELTIVVGDEDAV